MASFVRRAKSGSDADPLPPYTGPAGFVQYEGGVQGINKESLALIKRLDLAMKIEEGEESAIDDFATEALRALGYETEQTVIRTRKALWLNRLNTGNDVVRLEDMQNVASTMELFHLPAFSQSAAHRSYSTRLQCFRTAGSMHVNQRPSDSPPATPVLYQLSQTSAELLFPVIQRLITKIETNDFCGMVAVDEYVGCGNIQYLIVNEHEKPSQEAQEEEIHCVWGHELVGQFHQSFAYMMATQNICFEPIRADGLMVLHSAFISEYSALHSLMFKAEGSYLAIENSPSPLDLCLSSSSTQSTSLTMRFVAILAVATVSAFAVPLAETEVVAPVKGVVSAAADVLADVDAAVGNVAVKDSDVADNIGNNNNVDVLPRDLVTVGTLIEALANALAQADVSLKAVLANVDVQDSSILTDILNDNKITVLRRRDVVLPANIDALVLALINACVAAGVDVQAAVANIGIDYSTLLSNIGNNNVVFVRSLPETVDIAALVKAIADACAAVGVDIVALIANIDIQNSSILTDILNGNKVVVGRRDLPITLITADVLAVLKAIVTAALDAQIDVFATALNAGLDCTTILSNILNNNTITILPIFARDASLLDIYSTVLALVQALVAIGIPVDVSALNVFIQNSNIGTNILNDNIIKILGI
ncbi:hypothetical protein M422DRAFT_247421 [Sphaerobolus stellatus SS14]|nr:hypothetical protein M422DRAFT_247421 [Sphaerobolus stellatus SS14]